MKKIVSIFLMVFFTISVLSSCKAEQNNYNYGYESLQNKYERRLYNDILRKALKTSSEFINVPKEIKDPYRPSEILRAVSFDNPEIFWLRPIITEESNLKDGLKLTYYYNDEELENKKIIFNKRVNSIVKSIDLNSSEYEKELAIHDYIVDHCSFDKIESIESHSAYSAIIDGYSVCEGVSKAFKLLANKLSLDSTIIVGYYYHDTNPIQHAWNIVRINNEWYNLDVTHDLDYDKRFIIDKYDSFNVTDEYLRNKDKRYISPFFKSRKEDNNLFNDSNFIDVECIAEKYNYLKKQGWITIDDFDNLDEIKTEISKAVKKGEKSYQFFVSTEYDFDEVNNYIVNYLSEELLKSANSINKNNPKVKVNGIYIKCNRIYYLFSIELIYLSE